MVPLLAGPDSALMRRIRQAVMDSRAAAELTDVLGPHPLLAEALHVRLSEAGLARADRARLFTVATAADGIILATVGGEEAVQAAGITGMLLAARLAVPVMAAALDEEGAVAAHRRAAARLRLGAAGARAVPDRPRDPRGAARRGREGGGLRRRRGARRVPGDRQAGAVAVHDGAGHRAAAAGRAGALTPDRTDGRARSSRRSGPLRAASSGAGGQTKTTQDAAGA